MISLPVVVRNWHVKTPVVFRYMDQKYINEFFETGRLRLGAFSVFQKYPDEQRGDKDEGLNTLVGFGDGHTIVARTAHGTNSLILCTSTEGSQELMDAFCTNGYFKIKDTTNFGAAIANRIPGFLEGMEGFCIYAEQRIIQRQLTEFKFEDLKAGPDGNSISLDKLFTLTSQIGDADVLFVKQTRFKHQGEYRFIWNVSYEVSDAIILDCPEARQFCEKVT